ncbi:hypothetical protein ILP97_62075 [Amycolatopsis sp. H6(2020)]|nr:hypothetical protein [Amycolatopsis sp. H6(2020)]
MDWRSAIQRAGELLTNVGGAGSSYALPMIDLVEERGPYVVITPGFVLAYAHPEADAAGRFPRIAPPVGAPAPPSV